MGRNGPPTMPAANMPTAATPFSVRAPPFGNCSATMPKDVGQKKLFPTA